MVAALLRSSVAAGRPGLTLPLVSRGKCCDLLSLPLPPLPPLGLGGDRSPGVVGGVAVTAIAAVAAIPPRCVRCCDAVCGDDSNNGGDMEDTCRC